MAAIISGFTAGIGVRLGLGQPAFLSRDWFNQLAISTGLGAGIGGVTAEIKGGNFWQGAAQGAAWSAAGYVVSSILNKDEGQKEEDTFFFKTKKWLLERIVGAPVANASVNAGLAGAAEGFERGANAGAEIAVNEYSFGLTDRFGLTEGAMRVEEYGEVGQWSQRMAGVSRDTLLMAGGLGHAKAARL